MSAENDRWLEVALEIADGHPSDWDGLDSAAPEDQAMLRSLRLLSDLGGLHRDTDSAAVPRDTGAPAVVPGDTDPGAVSSLDAPRISSTDPTDGELDRWGDLVLLERIGEGASSEVFRARDTKLNRIVALKILRARSGAATTDLARTILEARRLAAVRHPNVVTVHSADSIGGRSGICMEYIKGHTLEALLRERGPLGPSELLALAESLCGALASIHAAGLVHQDVKTENVLREEGGRIVLMDLGLGGGTPLFVAPEAMEGRALDARSDLYSLGVLLYRMATGAFPVEGTTVDEIRLAHRRFARVPLRDRRPEFPAPLARVIERTLSSDPRERPASAGELERALLEAIGRSSAVDPSTTTSQRAQPPKAFGGPSARLWPASSRVFSSRHRRAWILGASVFAAAAIVLSLQLRDRSGAPQNETVQPLATAGTSAPYRISARVQRGGTDSEPLRANMQLGLGDSLSLRIEASDSLYVYVLNRDEAGHAYLVFPLAGLDTRNPLPPRPHQLPGTRGGRPFFWQVTTAGGREELLVLASRERLVGLETEALALARPDENAPVEYPSADHALTEGLRGLGGFVGGADNSPPPRPVELFETASALSEGVEEVQGVWMRKIAFRGPAAE